MRKQQSWLVQWCLLALVCGAGVALGLGGCRPQQPAKTALSRMTIFVNGYTVGYLRNCGCSSGQFGGELRKANLIRHEREDQQKQKPMDRGRPSEVLLLELGDFTDRQDAALALESAGIVESMTSLNYDSVGLGRNELAYPQAELLDLFGDKGLPLTACNLEFIAPVAGEDHSSDLNALVKPYLVITKTSGYRVGVIHAIPTLVAKDYGQRTGFRLTDPTVAVKAVLEQHKAEADLWILTVVDTEVGGINSLELAQLTDLALIIGFHNGKPKEAVSKQDGLDLPKYIPAPYRKARDLLRVVVSYDELGAVSDVVHERIPVSDLVQEDPTVKEIVARVQPELERLELTRAESQMGDMGPHPWYVGHSECAMCHQEIVAQMAGTKHTEAYEALREKGEHRSASCVRCHVVGHGTKSGWNVLSNQPEFQGVHCENCHGPGEYHVKAMSGQEKPADFQQAGRNALGLLPIKAEPAACLKCHDEQNSVNFNFERYWAEIKH